MQSLAGMQLRSLPTASPHPSCSYSDAGAARLRRLRPCAHQGQGDRAEAQVTRRQLAAGLLAGLAAAQLAAAGPSAAAVPFLKNNGGRGALADEEERLLRLRSELESEVAAELSKTRATLEAEATRSQPGKLCATPFGVDVVGITEFIALTGALVGGFSARQRKNEVEHLNEQLRKINMGLRQQARAGTVYAPGLTYAPPYPPDRLPNVSAFLDSSNDRQGSSATALRLPSTTLDMPSQSAIAEAVAAMPAAGAASMMASSDEDDMGIEAKQCLQALRDGKRLLKEQNGASAMVRFEKALMLAKSQNNTQQERRAVRGLAAAARLQGQYRAAISHLQRVLAISADIGDHVGDADAYGTIADVYTDLGEFEKAAEYYDRYISQMNKDGPV